MRLTPIRAAIALALSAAPASADDSALNREGFWTVGRGDAESPRCFASLPTKAGTMFILQAEKGEVTFWVGSDKRMRPGKVGVLSTEAYSFDFTPAFADDGELMLTEEALNARAVAALRLASGLVVKVDGREVFNAGVEDTGLEGALDAVVACSHGKSGWWGPGVGAEKTADGPVPNRAIDDPVYNKEGVWALAAGEEPAVCVAAALAGEDRQLQILAADGQVGFAVGTGGSALPRGRRGKVETDAYAFDFKPQYGADSYMAADAPFDSQAIFALKRAKWVRIKVDGRVLVDADVEASGLADVLDSAAACSRGEDGWWGKGAKAPG